MKNKIILFLSTVLALGIVNCVSSRNSVGAIKNGELETGKYELENGYSDGFEFLIDHFDREGTKKRIMSIHSTGSAPQLCVDGTAYSCGPNNIPTIKFSHDDNLPVMFTAGNQFSDTWNTEWDMDNNTAYTYYVNPKFLVKETLTVDDANDKFIVKYEVTNTDDIKHELGFCMPWMYRTDYYTLKDDSQRYEVEYSGDEIPELSLMYFCDDYDDRYTMDIDLSMNKDNPVDRMKLYYPSTTDVTRILSPYEAEMRPHFATPEPDQLLFRYISLIWDSESIAAGETKIYRAEVNINPVKYEEVPELNAKVSGKLWAKIGAEEEKDAEVTMNVEFKNWYTYSLYSVAANVELPYRLYFPESKDNNWSANITKTCYEIKPGESKTLQFKICVPKDYYINKGTSTKERIKITFYSAGFERKSKDEEITISEIDPFVVVSLGDSFSAGDTIKPYYEPDLQESITWEVFKHLTGQKPGPYEEEEILILKQINDYLAHRSTKSWPGLLEFSAINVKLRDYNVNYTNHISGKWYFEAVSGAKTENIVSIGQWKPESYNFLQEVYEGFSGHFDYDSDDRVLLPKQIDIFDQVEGTVDYVTLTIGGNDAGFEKIMNKCVTESNNYVAYQNRSSALENMIADIWDNMDNIMNDIGSTYEEIHKAAGPQSKILVADYPQLVDYHGGGGIFDFLHISKKEAKAINDNVYDFNNRIKDLVESYNGENGQRKKMDIYFIDVYKWFNDRGAYTSDPWIDTLFHPNERGAEEYALLVNEVIREIEE